MNRHIAALAVAVVVALGTPALLDAQQNQQNRPGTAPGTATTENTRPADVQRADRATDMEWGWLGLLGLAGLLGLRRRDVHQAEIARPLPDTGSNPPQRRTGTFG
jgi:MYXO-CTERM domain-containing protein